VEKTRSFLIDVVVPRKVHESPCPFSYRQKRIKAVFGNLISTSSGYLTAIAMRMAIQLPNFKYDLQAEDVPGAFDRRGCHLTLRVSQSLPLRPASDFFHYERDPAFHSVAVGP
jgi:hypothetical protein